MFFSDFILHLQLSLKSLFSIDFFEIDLVRGVPLVV